MKPELSETFTLLDRLSLGWLTTVEGAAKGRIHTRVYSTDLVIIIVAILYLDAHLAAIVDCCDNNQPAQNPHLFKAIRCRSFGEKIETFHGLLFLGCSPVSIRSSTCTCQCCSSRKCSSKSELFGESIVDWEPLDFRSTDPASVMNRTDRVF
jgi:hypothetical protein